MEFNKISRDKLVNNEMWLIWGKSSWQNRNPRILDGILQDIKDNIGVEWYGSITQLVMGIKESFLMEVNKKSRDKLVNNEMWLIWEKNSGQKKI